MRTFVKSVGSTLVYSIDLAAVIAPLSPVGLSYVVRADPGVDVQASLNLSNTLTFTVSGGIVGRLYRFGVQVTTEAGVAEVVNHLLRVRQDTDIGTAPVIDTITEPTEESYLTSATDGVLLVSAASGILLY